MCGRPGAGRTAEPAIPFPKAWVHSSVRSAPGGTLPSGIRRLNIVRMKQLFSYRFLVIAFMTLAFCSLLFGHIRIAPTESTAGAREKYTMRVPNEKQVACSKIEGEFPAGRDIYDFEFK